MSKWHRSICHNYLIPKNTTWHKKKKKYCHSTYLITMKIWGNLTTTYSEREAKISQIWTKISQIWTDHIQYINGTAARKKWIVLWLRSSFDYTIMQHLGFPLVRYLDFRPPLFLLYRKVIFRENTQGASKSDFWCHLFGQSFPFQ